MKIPLPKDLSEASDVAQVFIAAVNIALAVYIFIYQRNQSSRSEATTAQLNEQNIKLQWFKDLIVQPNLHFLYFFYSNLETGLRQGISSDNLSEAEIMALNRFIKDEAKAFRISFTDSILQVNRELYDRIKTNVDELVSEMTKALSDDEHKLTNSKTFDKVLGDPIRYSRNSVLAILYSYKGV